MREIKFVDGESLAIDATRYIVSEDVFTFYRKGEVILIVPQDRVLYVKWFELLSFEDK